MKKKEEKKKKKRTKNLFLHSQTYGNFVEGGGHQSIETLYSKFGWNPRQPISDT
tara:strand:- start:235 stop:396 length:162 start_codon:yes stop_codon:yes gene_type:complete